MKYKLEEEKHYDSVYFDKKIEAYTKYNDYSFSDKCLHAGRIKCENLAKQYLSNLDTALILDYGCAIGEKTFNFIDDSKKVIGIDISSQSIKIANEISNKNQKNSEFKVMDCEKLEFPDNTFDLVYDFGTLSSLNIDNAVNEMYRVLKPGGVLIGIETLGNNPIFILKRYINVLRGKRTKWAVSHILKLKKWKCIRGKFSKYEQYFYGVTTPFLVPLLYIVPKKKNKNFISIFDSIDRFLVKIFFFRILAFKIVFKLVK